MTDSPGARALLTAALVVCLALAGSVGAVTASAPPAFDTNPPLTNATATQPDAPTPTTSQSDAPTLTTTTASVDPGETTTVTVLLTSAPEGLAGYELVVSLSDDAATITDATYPEGFGLTTDPQIVGDVSSVTLEAADTASTVEPGATNATLATLTIRGESVGTVAVELDARQLDADGGGEFTPATVPGTVTVGDPTTATPTAGDDATDRHPGSADTGEETSVTTALPLAGVGVSLLAVVLVAGLLGRRG
ncbi:cell surface protein [Salinirubrum litoreum]|uniref:Cohesin domain-containing protein n=1 Tax=Salinirubrum litoreum TaxID=1126234 RepID=A0ABD5RFN0_9EURY|nr:cell surface protein [Salinirubrum litoreum]